jgi:hypothetical protein
VFVGPGQQPPHGSGPPGVLGLSEGHGGVIEDDVEVDVDDDFDAELDDEPEDDASLAPDPPPEP